MLLVVTHPGTDGVGQSLSLGVPWHLSALEGLHGHRKPGAGSGNFKLIALVLSLKERVKSRSRYFTHSPFPCQYFWVCNRIFL